MYDAIIVGSRVAGAPLAMQLARKGHRVLAVDRAHFPSDTLSTHLLNGDAVPRLRAWGVLDKVIEAGTPVFAQTYIGLNGWHTPVPGGPLARLCPRRSVLDTVLVDAALEAGAEVRQGFSVRELLRDDAGRVAGISGIDDAGNAVREEAGIVIGADGRNSFVARQVGAEMYNTLPNVSCGYFSYFSGPPADAVHVAFAPGRAAFAFPTNDGLTLLAAQFPHTEFDQIRRDPDASVAQAFEATGLGELHAGAKRVEKWYGIVGDTWYYRKPYGPGWALAGDAGLLKDPILGMGINDAFRDADTLSAALDEAFSGRTELETALANYQEQRDAATIGPYLLNYEFSKLQVTPELLMVLAKAAARPSDLAEAA